MLISEPSGFEARTTLACFMEGVPMRLTGAVGFVVLSILAPLSTTAAEPTFEILGDPSVLRCFARLVSDGGYGFRPSERAAFLVLEADQSLACIYWPATHEFKEARWRGPMPQGVVALAHTHPLSSPDASTDDINEARRIGMPIFILTPNLIRVVHADGRVETLVCCRVWVQAVETSGASAARRHSSRVALHYERFHRRPSSIL
jgi:hypothetical protein